MPGTEHTARSAPAHRPHTRIERWAVPLALLLLALFQLGAAPLFDVDEGAFSEATREMLVSGDWGHTTLNGEDRFDKPILVYWLQAASVAVLGLHEFALRLPSALCAWGWAWGLWAFARPRLGARVAAGSALMLATSLGVVAIGRAATADALLNCLLAWAAFDAWRWLEGGARTPLRRAFLWMGLGLLAKGPVAVLVPVAAALVWLVGSGRLQEAGRRILAGMSDPIAWTLMLTVAVPWYAYALNRHGQAFIDGFFVRHNLARYSSAMEQHGGHWAYYLVVLPLLLLPWTPLLVGVLRNARAHWRDPLGRFLLGWGAFVVVFFSLSGTKLPHYVLYGATPFVLLMALELGRAGAVMRGAIALACLFLLALVSVPAMTVSMWAAQVRPAHFQTLLAGAPSALALAVASALAALAVLALHAVPALRARWSPAGPSLLSAALCVMVALGFGLPWWGNTLQGPVRAAAQVARGYPEPAVQWKLHQPSFAVYREQATPRRLPQPGELALVRTELLDRLRDPSNRWETLFRARGFALVRWQAGSAR